jgi:hypothetical protein
LSIQDVVLSNQDAYVLARHIAHLDTQGLNASPPARLLMEAFKSDDPLHVKALTDLLERMGAMKQVFAIDPATPPPEFRKAKTEDVFIPPLPAAAQLSDTALKAMEGVGGWYKEAVQWTTQRSPMTPVHFLEAGIAWIIGLAIARRVYIEFHERIYPHLYLLLVAETSKYAKSTGMNALYALVMGAMPHMLIPGQASPEGMIEMLAGELPSNFEKLPDRDKDLINAGRKFAAQRGIVMDEFSTLLGSAKKDYMHGFIELLLRLYDARDVEMYYTRTGGMSVIRRPGIPIMGATTPAAMARACTYESWENGANARYLIMFRDEPLEYNPNWIPAAPPFALVHALEALHNALPTMKDDLNQDVNFETYAAGISNDALNAYKAYTQAVFYDMINNHLDEQTHGNYRRMHIQALKIALAVATMDWLTETEGKAGRPAITLGHWALGQTMAEKSRESLHRLMPVLNESFDSRTQRDLMTILRQNPSGGFTVREIVRRTGRQTKDIRSALDVLVEAGEVYVSSIQPQTGRPTQLYFLTPDDGVLPPY